jgi:hypothetical protein
MEASVMISQKSLLPMLKTQNTTHKEDYSREFNHVLEF